MIRNIIFDWSGTLADDLGLVLRATNHVFEHVGRPPISEEEFRREFALPFQNFYERYLPGVEIDKLDLVFHAHFRQAHDQVEMLPHAREFLDFCRRHGVRMFILSTIFKDHFQALVRRHSLEGYFEKTYLEIMDKRAVISRVIEENGLTASETLFIGDMQHDIEAAQTGSVYSCGVLTGFNRRHQLEASNPTLIVDHLGQLAQLLTHKKFQLDEPSKVPIPTVGGLIFNQEDEVLMIRTHKWSDLWGIPGGKIQWGETSGAALEREILEETNLRVSEIEFVLVQDCISSREFYRDAHFLLLNYTCRAQSPCEVRLNEEAQEWRWVSLEKVFDLPLNMPTQFLLREVIRRKV